MTSPPLGLHVELRERGGGPRSMKKIATVEGHA